MPNITLRRLQIASVTVFFVMTAILVEVNAQGRKLTPDISVAGVKLGDRASARAFLEGYQPRTDGGVPTYYFYNKRITTVMKLTGVSFEDPYFITEIEVFNVGQEYQSRHFVLEKIGTFATESGIFIGFRQKGGDLALAMIVGVPNVGRSNMIGPKDVIKRQGEPNERARNGEEETFDYRLDTISLPSPEGTTDYLYAAHYRFYERKLNRFSLRIEPSRKDEPPKKT